MQVKDLTHNLGIREKKYFYKNQSTIIINKRILKKRMQKFVKYCIRNYCVRKFVLVAAWEIFAINVGKIRKEITKAIYYVDRFLCHMFAKASLNINQWGSKASKDNPMFSFPALNLDWSWLLLATIQRRILL